MITKRTDSQGLDFKNVRLELLRNCLNEVNVTGIYKLNDHKGDLTVVWENEINTNESEKVDLFWEAFCEYNIEHISMHTNQIYKDLFNDLCNAYPECVNMVQGEIIVNHKANLFDYMAYEFYGVFMEEMDLYKIVKKYSDNFYCEWYDNFNQIIAINYDNIK